MHKLVLISRGGSSILQIDRLRADLNMKGFFVLNADALVEGSDMWWRAFKEDIQNCKALVVMLVPTAKTSPQTKRELKLAREHGVPIFPLLLEGDAANSIPDELLTTEWIDVSSDDKYQAGLKILVKDIFIAFGIDPTGNHPMIRNELHQITVHIPDVKWIRIIQVGYLVHPTYRFDAVNINDDMEENIEEGRYGAMTAAVSTISERLSYEFMMGKSRFVVIAGEEASHFLLPIGDGAEWLISFVVKGHPPVDETIKYFEARNYLAHIVPFLGIPQADA